MAASPHFSASCLCRRVMLETMAPPIVSVACYCESCRLAARQFEQSEGAPPVLNADAGVDYCLFRKDRIKVVRGGEHLRAHRLTASSPTRRVVAACCNAPMFLDFTPGHWLNLYRDRMPPGAPAIELGVMTKARQAGSGRAGPVRTYPGMPGTASL
jgi:hypothetical protein